MKKDDPKFLVSPFLDCYYEVKQDLKAYGLDMVIWFIFLVCFLIFVGWFVK